MTKLKFSTDQKALYIAGKGNFSETSQHAFPLSDFHLNLRAVADAAPGQQLYVLEGATSHGAPVRIAGFDTEFEAVKTLHALQARLRRRRVLDSASRFARVVFWPAAGVLSVLALTVSLNGALSNLAAAPQLAAQPALQQPAPSALQPPQASNGSAAAQQPAADPLSVYLSQMQGPKQLAANDLASLQDAVKNGHFTVSLSSGHKKTLYVFSDPRCPHCRDFEPRLQELSKTYNIEIFPVSVFADLKSLVRAAPVLDTDKDKRTAKWAETIRMPLSTLDPKLDNPTEEPKTDGAMLVNANNTAFMKFQFYGTPTIIADDGRQIPVGVVSDDNLLGQFEAGK